MNKVKLTFVANKNISAETIHSLYTSVIFLNEKKENSEEEFKVFNNGRMATIIMNENLIENNQNNFTFMNFDGEIKLKLLKKEPFVSDVTIKQEDVVSVFGLISHTQKFYTNEDGSKRDNPVEYCVLNQLSQFKPKTKKQFLSYLTEKTGLDFISAEKEGNVSFERVVSDENEIVNGKTNKKVLMRNIIAINGSMLKVINSQVANSLSYKMIGKRKTYGFGNITIL